MPSVATTIEILDISSFLANNDASKGALFGQRLNPKLPVILFMIGKVLRNVYESDNNYADLQKVADYGFYLCAPYNATALSLIDGGTGGVVISPTSPTQANTWWWIRVESSDFVNVTDYDNAKLLGHNLKIFDNNNQKYLNRPGDPPDWGYTSTGIRFYNIDTTTGNWDFIIYIEGGTPDSSAGGGREPLILKFTAATYDISWTTDLQNTYGIFPAIELWLLDTTINKYYLANVQPTIDQPPPNTTLISYDFGGETTGFILIK